MDRRYRAYCVGNKLAESSTAKTPSVKLIFKTTFDHDAPENRVEKTLFADLWLSEKCFERTMDTLTKVMGWSGDNLFEMNDPMKLAGIEVDLVTGEEDYNGKTMEKVKFINAPGSLSVTPMEDGQASLLADQIRGRLLLYRQKNEKQPVPEVKRAAVGTVGAARTAAPTVPEDDDPTNDLPF